MPTQLKPEKTLAIVLPALDEGSVIGRVLDELPNSLRLNSKDFSVRVIVVNDASSDDTEKVVRRRPHVILINHLLQSGAGAATRTGLHYARNLGCDYAVTMDADGQHSTKDVKA